MMITLFRDYTANVHMSITFTCKSVFILYGSWCVFSV